jgi:molybdopterin/thiamine biosynthesis adenylyltransferase/rhodanese-related sulfurtransferase
VALSSSERLRYQRQISLPEIGESGQLRLKAARVLIIGVGGLGCPAALYLAAAGVGHLTLVDPDRVALSNLQRQILYGPADLGQPKTTCAQQRLQAQNPTVTIETHAIAATSAHVSSWLANHDLVIDGSDQLPLRLALNAACRAAQVPWVYGSVYRFEGQLARFDPAGPCYRCLFPQPPATVPDCNSAGVLGVLPGLIGTLQALEALKWLLGQRDPTGLLLVDGLALRFENITLSQDPNCPGCGPNAEAPPALRPELLAAELAQWRAHHPEALCLDLRADQSRPLPPLLQPARPLTDLSAIDPEGRPLLLVCQRGQRARAAQEQLCQAGHQAILLSGGLEALAEFEQEKTSLQRLIADGPDENPGSHSGYPVNHCHESPSECHPHDYNNRPHEKPDERQRKVPED